MNIELPLETWASLLGFLSRPYLGEIVPRVGNQQFATIIQFFLHKYGAVKLGDLLIGVSMERDGAVVRKCTRGDWGPPVPIDPDCEIPKNVKDFEAFLLSYLDNPAIVSWLQKFQQRHLFTNMHLLVHSVAAFDDIVRSLDTLLPLLESVESVSIRGRRFLAKTFTQYEQQEQQSGGGNPLAQSWLARARLLEICDDEMQKVPSYFDRIFQWPWTSSPHPNGPRVLLLSLFGTANAKCFLERVEKDFINAEECASYFIRFKIRYPWSGIESKSLPNARTKEQFSIKVAADNSWVLISRFSERANPGWIAEKEKEVLEWDFVKQSRRIVLIDPPLYSD